MTNQPGTVAIDPTDRMPRQRVRLLDSEISYVDIGAGVAEMSLHRNPTSSHLRRNLSGWLRTSNIAKLLIQPGSLIAGWARDFCRTRREVSVKGIHVSRPGACADGRRAPQWLTGLRCWLTDHRARRELRRCVWLDPRFASDIGLTAGEIAHACNAPLRVAVARAAERPPASTTPNRDAYRHVAARRHAGKW